MTDTSTLKEIQKQMEDKIEEVSSNPCSEDDSEKSSENFIIKNMLASSNKKRKTPDGEISFTLLAQHEMDNKKIERLIKKIYNSKTELSRAETQLYRLRLEYNNQLINIKEIEEKNKRRNNELIRQKNNISFVFVISALINFLFMCFNLIY